MNVRKNISKDVVAAATGLLSSFVEDLSPTRLIAALEAYDNADSGGTLKNDHIKPPMTIQQVCQLLGISRPSVYRLKEKDTYKYTVKDTI